MTLRELNNEVESSMADDDDDDGDGDDDDGDDDDDDDDGDGDIDDDTEKTIISISVDVWLPEIGFQGCPWPILSICTGIYGMLSLGIVPPWLFGIPYSATWAYLIQKSKTCHPQKCHFEYLSPKHLN